MLLFQFFLIFVLQINYRIFMTKFLGILSIIIGIGWGLAMSYVARNASEIERQERIRKWQKIKEAQKNKQNKTNTN